MKIATIGTGVIVEGFIDACHKVDGVEVVAVYSRQESTGKILADKFGITKIFTDINTMLKDVEIDTVYVASPNSLHFTQTLDILNAGKNAIVEKPFCSTDEESAQLIAKANEKGCYLFEAMSIRFMPNLELLKQKLSLIEPIKWTELSMCQYSSKFNALRAGELPNVFNPEFSGGAFMDLNIYHLNFAIELFGYPTNSQYFANLHPNGIDLSGMLYMQYPHMTISAIATKDSVGKPYGVIHGENGMIEFNEGVNGLRSFTLTQNKEKTIFNVQTQDNRLVYEVQAFESIIKNGNRNEMNALLDKTQMIMKLMTKIRRDAGLYFAADKK